MYRYLNRLDLLGYSRQHSFLKTIELIKAAPSPNLAKADKNPSHGLEVKGFIAIEYQDKSSKLVSKCLDSFSFASSSRAKW